ncbi:MAG: phosphoribosylglycinamide formyltransferase [Rhodospirillales bacterium]|nr:phosphoribosylglycinamide formyltransferase [Rhodospirillales bacterium]
MGVEKINLAIFISGRGSNMEALIDACQALDFPAQICVVFSNKPEAVGLAKAQAAGIATEVVDHRDFPKDKPGFEAAIQEKLAQYPVDLICLAGFMRILSADFIARWPGRIINIHPSLLPKFKGLDTHERALEAGETEHGCTVHYVVPEMDAGPVILQKAVPVLPGDTPDTLAARVLVQEHAAYPEAVRTVCETIKKSS